MFFVIHQKNSTQWVIECLFIQTLCIIELSLAMQRFESKNDCRVLPTKK